MGVDGGQFIPIILDLMKRGFLDLLGPSNDPEFFWQVISGPACIQGVFEVEAFLVTRGTIHYFKEF
jgi:hypothetical protein